MQLIALKVLFQIQGIFISYNDLEIKFVFLSKNLFVGANDESKILFLASNLKFV